MTAVHQAHRYRWAPREHGRHRPRQSWAAFGAAVVAAVVVAVTVFSVIEGVDATPRAAAATASDVSTVQALYAEDLVSRMNAERSARAAFGLGIPPLQVDPSLAAYAQGWSAHLAAVGTVADPPLSPSCSGPSTHVVHHGRQLRQQRQRVLAGGRLGRDGRDVHGLGPPPPEHAGRRLHRRRRRGDLQRRPGLDRRGVRLHHRHHPLGHGPPERPGCRAGPPGAGHPGGRRAAQRGTRLLPGADRRRRRHRDADRRAVPLPLPGGGDRRRAQPAGPVGGHGGHGRRQRVLAGPHRRLGVDPRRRRRLRVDGRLPAQRPRLPHRGHHRRPRLLAGGLRRRHLLVRRRRASTGRWAGST